MGARGSFGRNPYRGGHLKKEPKAHWIADCKKQEYREVLSALTAAMMTYVLHYAPQPIVRPGRTMVDEEAAVAEAISNTIFINDVVEKLRAFARWSDASNAISQNRDVAAFGALVREVLRDIRREAQKDIAENG